MSGRGVVHVVVPDGIDDPLRPSGGNTYDRRLCSALTGSGWSVRVVPVCGAWPWAGDAGSRALAGALDGVPDGERVLVDGLVASAYPEVVVPVAGRLRVVVLMHLPIGADPVHVDARQHECTVVNAVASVVATSEWTRRWLLEAYAVDPLRVRVVPPGVDRAPPAAGTYDGDRLLCVGSVTPGKGHDLLVAALARISDLTWRCACVGPTTAAPDFVAGLRQTLREAGLEDRVELAGPHTGRELDEAYAGADLLVHPSRGETYGMVVTEALARALPVVAADVGGVREALGATSAGTVPGLVAAAGDVTGLAESLRRWLSDPGLRQGLRDAARERRAGLTGWSETADRVARVLDEVAA